jgi:hypothetical protein
MTRARRAAIYRKAARLIERGDWDRSCWAVTAAEFGSLDHRSDDANVDAYADFMLGGCQVSSRLFSYIGHDSQKAQDIRVLLLCFMACAVETGDA